MAVTIFHRVINNNKIKIINVNDDKNAKPIDLKSRIESKKHARRIVKKSVGK